MISYHPPQRHRALVQYFVPIPTTQNLNGRLLGECSPIALGIIVIHAPIRMQVLRGLASRYEAHHHVSYTDEAIAAAVALSVQHIPDRQLPDKALDLLDEAGSRARIAAHAARVGAGDPHHSNLHLELTQVCAACMRRARGR